MKVFSGRERKEGRASPWRLRQFTGHYQRAEGGRKKGKGDDWIYSQASIGTEAKRRMGKGREGGMKQETVMKCWLRLQGRSVKTQGTAPADGARRKTEGPRLLGVETVFVLEEARTWGTKADLIDPVRRDSCWLWRGGVKSAGGIGRACGAGEAMRPRMGLYRLSLLREVSPQESLRNTLWCCLYHSCHNVWCCLKCKKTQGEYPGPIHDHPRMI